MIKTRGFRLDDFFHKFPLTVRSPLTKEFLTYFYSELGSDADADDIADLSDLGDRSDKRGSALDKMPSAAAAASID